MNQKLLVVKDQVNLLNLCRQYHAQSDNLSNITGDNQLPLNGKLSGFELSHVTRVTRDLLYELHCPIILVLI